MRQDQFMQLLEAEEKGYAARNKRRVAILSEKDAYSAYMIIERYLCIGDTVDTILKRLVRYGADRDYSDEKLRRYIETLLPAPVRETYEATPKQRSMDRIARLLTVEDRYTPCIATALHGGALIVAANSPKLITGDDLAARLVRKITIVRNFLETLVAGTKIDELSEEKIENIQYTQEAIQSAKDAVEEIISDDVGGVGNILPANPKGDRGTEQLHLEKALLKLGRDVLLGIYTDGVLGFTEVERTALLDSRVKIFIPEDDSRIGNVHAEQAICIFLKRARRDAAAAAPAAAAEKTYIGTSKLCCQACAKALSADDSVAYRGKHGLGYPGVLDSSTRRRAVVLPTKRMGQSLTASDSESDYEEVLPEVAKLITQKPDELLAAGAEARGKSKPMAGASLRLFKPCSAEAGAKAPDPSASKQVVAS